MKSIVIFASGSGTNAGKIIEYFKENSEIRVSALFTDRPGCGAADKAEKNGIQVVVFTSSELYNGTVLNKLKLKDPDLLVLAGFLRLLPSEIIGEFRHKIINIHPALLPKYGGKGYYGKFVHEAVIKANDSESGITIHLVDEEYDKGKIIFQEKCMVVPGDTADTLAARIRQLEHKYYPVTIEKLLMKMQQ